MKALLYCERDLLDSLGLPYYCLVFPEANILSEPGCGGQVYSLDDERAKAWIDNKESILELDVPFDLVARLYCHVMNFRIDYFKRADFELWEDKATKDLITSARVELIKSPGPTPNSQ